MAIATLYAGLTTPVVGGGSGGGPQGDNQVWVRADFAALDALTGITDGDLGITQDNGFIYYREGGAWSFWRGAVPLQADLPAEPVTIGAIASVGGGALEDQTQFVWSGAAWVRAPNVASMTWAVASSAGLTGLTGARDGDRALAIDTEFIWQLNSGTWELVYGLVATAASLPSSNVNGDALFGVGTDGIHERTWYGRHAGAWVRTPQNRGYARTLSSLQDVLVTDLDGDYGLFGTTTLRLKRGITLAPSGTVDLWVPPVVYAGTITMRAWFTGSESNTGLATTLANQGFTVFTAGSGTLNTTTSPGFLRLSDNNVGSSSASLGITAFASSGLTTSTKWYMQAAVRVPLASYASTATPTVRDGTNAWNLEVASTGASLTTNTAGNTVAIRSGGVATPTTGTPTVLQIVDEGATVATTVIRDGNPYLQNRRNNTTLAVASNMFIGDISSANTGMTHEWRHCYILTWV